MDKDMELEGDNFGHVDAATHGAHKCNCRKSTCISKCLRTIGWREAPAHNQAHSRAIAL